MRISDWSSDVCSSDLRLQSLATGTQAAAKEHLPPARSGRSRWETNRTSVPGVCRTPPTPRTSATFTRRTTRSEEHTSELQSLMRISYAVFCLKKQNDIQSMYRQQYKVLPSYTA